MNKILRPPFKIHGGKRFLSNFIISKFPENYETYDFIEPFCGAASVLINKKPPINDKIEVINDIDIGIIQIFKALRDEPKHFINLLKKLNYSEEVFQKEKEKTEFDDYIKHAVREFAVRRMSRGGMKNNFGWSSRLRGGIPGDVNAWNTILELLPTIANRIKDVKIFNKPATKIISAFDSEKTLVFCDPPYAKESRTAKNVYEFEMTDKEHKELADELMKFKGKAIISGYSCPLYEELYKEWKWYEKKIPNHASQEKTKKIMTEKIWYNF